MSELTEISEEAVADFIAGADLADEAITEALVTKGTLGGLESPIHAGLKAAYPAIREQVLREAEARIERTRLTDGPGPFQRLDGDELVYNRAIDDCLAALRGENP